MVFTIKEGFSVNNKFQALILRNLLSARDEYAYTNIKLGDKKYDTNLKSFEDLLVDYPDVYNKHPKVQKKLKEFIANLKLRKQGMPLIDNPSRIEYEYVQGPPGLVKLQTPTNTISKTPTQKRRQRRADKIKPLSTERIDDLYTQVLSNDKDAYTRLMFYATTKHDNAKNLKSIINKKYGYKPAHPMYIKPSAKKKDIFGNFQDHFKIVSYIKTLDKVQSSGERLEGGKKFNSFLLENDPRGQNWVQATHLNKYLDDDQKIRTDLKQGAYNKVLNVVNARLGLLGIQKLKPLGFAKEQLKDVLIPVNYGNLMNVYKIFPTLEKPELEIAKEKLIAERSLPMDERPIVSQKQARDQAAASLMGELTEQERIVSDLQDDFDQLDVSQLMKVKDGKIVVNLNPVNNDSNKHSDIKKGVEKIIAEQVMVQILTNKLRELNTKKEFRVNTPVGRMNILQKSLKGYTPSKKDYTNGLEQLEKHGFISDLQDIIVGEPGDVKFNEVRDNLLAIPHLPDDKLTEISDYINVYNKDILPDLQKEYSETRGLSVDAPSDVRMLPPGVKMTPVDIKEVQEERLNKKINVLNYKNDIKTQTRILNDPAASKANKREALGKIEDIKSKLSEAKLKDDQKKKYQSVRESASKRVGALRPHFKNDTEKNVKDAIGETPEQQIQDFKNWFVFDIPKDQTGQGSSNKNPLVAQNELRQKFIGEGNIFDNFNQAYDIKPGIDNRKDFYTQHSKLTKTNVAQGLKNAKISSEEDKFLAKFDKENNGLFTQDQTKQEHNKWQNIYQKPGRFFQDPTYPLAENSNTSLLVSDFKKNLLYFIEP